MAIEPVTREERFLAAAGGQSVTPPTPITRKEQLLQGIIDAVKSGGATPDVIENAVNNYLNANPVQPGATTEQVAQIEQNKTDIADLQTEVDELKESGGNGSGQNVALTDKERSTLIAVVNAIGVFNAPNGRELIDAFNTAWGGEVPEEPEQPEKTLTSISAAYSGGEVAVGTALSELTGVVVTAHYSDGSTAVVTGYNLSGEIAEGSNTITVSYGGMTATFTVTGIDATKVYGVDLTWGGKPEYGEWSADGKWFRVHYSESKASVQVGNGFAVEKTYSKPIDGNAYRYFRVPTNEGSQYAVANNVEFYGCDSPDALTEAGHPVTKCAKAFKFVPCDFAEDSDTEGMTILYPTDQYDYYYIKYGTSNSMTETYPELLGIFDANILENPLANPTE